MKKKYDYFIYYLPLFAFLFIGMGSILLSVSLSSCSSSVKNPLLLCADSLMEVSPDSALSILESISSPQKLSRADRALYALLLTQARHKNYVPLDDDSLKEFTRCTGSLLLGRHLSGYGTYLLCGRRIFESDSTNA